MRETGAPYGEARRLRYFVIACKELLELPSVDIDLFINKLLEATSNLNSQLDQYLRATGIMQSHAVARNYLRFADWLDFLRIENRIVVPNSYTVFFANINGRKDFFLTEREKTAFFLKLVELEDFIRLIGLLRIKNSINAYIRLLDLSEHLVESYFEWLVDLGILKPIQRKFGLFELSNLGYQLRESIRNDSQQLKVCGTYIEHLVGVRLDYDFRISERQIWDAFHKTLNKLGQHTQSEVDPGLYSAYPLILGLQIRLIFDHNLIVPIPFLIEKLKDISTNYNALFSWDSLANAGYIKLQREKK